jgi:hypothetical protein
MHTAPVFVKQIDNIKGSLGFSYSSVVTLHSHVLWCWFLVHDKSKKRGICSHEIVRFHLLLGVNSSLLNLCPMCLCGNLLLCPLYGWLKMCSIAMFFAFGNNYLYVLESWLNLLSVTRLQLKLWLLQDRKLDGRQLVVPKCLNFVEGLQVCSPVTSVNHSGHWSVYYPSLFIIAPHSCNWFGDQSSVIWFARLWFSLNWRICSCHLMQNTPYAKHFLPYSKCAPSTL